MPTPTITTPAVQAFLAASDIIAPDELVRLTITPAQATLELTGPDGTRTLTFVLEDLTASASTGTVRASRADSGERHVAKLYATQPTE